LVDLLLFGPLASYCVILISWMRIIVEDHKEREERERLLKREVNHRAKNLLSVVDAIAHQTAAQDPEDFAQRFSERIQFAFGQSGTTRQERMEGC
jgi:Tfp pilus assembly protein PilN